ncbi:MAG: hypothetical protein JJE40_18015 [Vicinamibacteria bacterium]|nr:hypothetical protein [Vicinamibacteria bacterium]
MTEPTWGNSMVERRPATLLTIAWLVLLSLGVCSAAVVVLGVRRDTRAGEATIPLSLGATSDWQTTTCRVWKPGRFTLFVSTVNFDQSRVGARFDGELQVAVRHHDGSPAFDRRFGPGTLDHVMPYNYGDTTLASLPLDAAWIRPWTVSVRVIRADARYAGVRSEIKLWRERADAGMGGLITYVLIIPAIMLLLLALFFSFLLARRGRIVPLVASLVVAGSFLVAFMW